MRDHLDCIMEVMEQAFDPAYGEAWTRRQVEDALSFGNCHYRLIGHDGRPPSPAEPAAGFSLSRIVYDEEELLLFAIAPQWRRQGLGQQLLSAFAIDAASRGARRLLLEMRRGNPAEVLYRKFGFEPIGERPNYYRTADGSRLDALTFAKSIT